MNYMILVKQFIVVECSISFKVIQDQGETLKGIGSKEKEVWYKCVEISTVRNMFHFKVILKFLISCAVN